VNPKPALQLILQVRPAVLGKTSGKPCRPACNAGTCTGSCVNAHAMDYTPRQMWRLVQLDDKAELFRSKTSGLFHLLLLHLRAHGASPDRDHRGIETHRRGRRLPR